MLIYDFTRQGHLIETNDFVIKNFVIVKIKNIFQDFFPRLCKNVIPLIVLAVYGNFLSLK